MTRGSSAGPLATNLGFPRIGVRRELKWAVEGYWSGELDADELERRASELRRDHWRLQAELGLDHVPSNDFSLYDTVLDTAVLVGAVPPRYGWSGDEPVGLETYFAMARGRPGAGGDGGGLQALEMTKWFDTNYHYLVPELQPDQPFRPGSTKPVDEFVEAREAGVRTRPVLLGPVSFLLLAKTTDGSRSLDLLDRLLPVYRDVLRRLAEAGAEWVQLDEPCLVLDLPEDARRAYRRAYDGLGDADPDLRILVASYFGPLRENLSLAAALPVDALHVDLVRAPDELERCLSAVPEAMRLSLGVVNGRNVWRTDLPDAFRTLRRAVDALGPERIFVAPSCSLLHVPVDLEREGSLAPELRRRMAFARQKVEEVVDLVGALRRGGTPEALDPPGASTNAPRREDPVRGGGDTAGDDAPSPEDASASRERPFPERKRIQREHLPLPRYPTTTIGSFPQTPELRRTRASYREGALNREDYERFLEETVADTVRRQEELGLDVLVHGEPERNDMVQYFAEQLEGYAFTEHGWVQSYGSRCVRPPILHGDVARPKPMTLRWIGHAQSCTDRPVKAILTGPVTMLQWSFVRDDQPRSRTCRQIAGAVREEVLDLEDAGVPIVQIDEPALREGLPLRRDRWDDYLDWAVGAFRIAASGVADRTQIHTHMCYADFGDIVDAIAAMDADVVYVEAARSRMALLDTFTEDRYGNDVGPGVFDIHSPRIPSVDEMVALLREARSVLGGDRLWVNPDCGLKTRRWDEVEPALRNMVTAARRIREEEE